MTRYLVLTAFFGVAAGCNASGPFVCSSDRACRSADQVGWCEPVGFCSFPDGTCPSGRRFGDLAADGYADRCVDPSSMGEGDTGGSSDDPGSSGEDSGGADGLARDEGTHDESGSDEGSSEGGSAEGGGTGVPDEQVFRNLVFITSQEVVPAEIGGLAGADALCGTLAADAGLSGQYVAWLSTVDAPARDRLVGAGGWVNTLGEPFAASLDDLVAMELLYPIRYDEMGADRATASVVTASTQAGVFDASNGSGDCNGWTEASGQVRDGRVGALGRAWTSSWQTACSAPSRLVCFGVDDAVEVGYEPAPPQRVAFVSDAVLPGSAGLDGFDAACVAEAQAAGLSDPSTFVALVSTSSQPAVDRLDLGGPGWSLVNGVPVVDAAADLGEPGAILRAPIFRTADGTPLPGPGVWSGAALATDAATGGACADWSSNVGTAPVGNGNRTTDWFQYTTAPCSETRHVLCLQAAVE